MTSRYMNNQQLIVITGARNTGKSTLAWTFLPPNDIDKAYIHDSEKSGNRILSNLNRIGKNPGRYISLGSRFGNLPETDDLLHRINKGELPWVDKSGRDALIEYYNYILDDLDKNLIPGKYKVYIHDTIEKLESSMAAWVEANKRSAGVTSTAYGKLWSSGVYPLYENLMESLYNRGIETIIFTSHLRNPWEGGRPIPGKVSPSGKKILYRLSSLMLWLVNERSNQDGAPAGLVLKERMGNLEIVDNSWKIKRMLPERIPHCTWNDIDKYLTIGCNLADPSTGERMSTQEKEMISELLTDEQMKLMILSEERELEEMRQQQNVSVIPTTTSDNETVSMPVTLPKNISNVSESTTSSEIPPAYAAALELYISQGMNNVDIAKHLNLPLPEVIKARRSLEE